jgi:hypothetical protein
VNYQYVLLIGILVAAVCISGCTGDDPAAPKPAAGPVEPGQVLYLTGQVTGEGVLHGTIDTITLTTGLVTGEPPLNMEDVTIIYADAVRTETLIPVEGFRGEPPQGTWSVVAVNGELGSPNNRMEYEEQFVLRLNPSSPLVPRQVITIIITPKGTTPLTIRRVSPPTILEQNNILANL